ncbi:nuclear transport factor 2 family protein [Pseudonocardia sp. NPDC049154]|uniref:nuclear transport factor 2 family protein n=1 Tax=Pseudonocardia sp. NPDC049154 TaxID=3155501 RepID=UPI0033FBEB61
MSAGTAVEPAVAREAVERHRALFNAADRAGWLANFVEEPFLEEPVGSPVRHGREHFGAVLDALAAHGVRATIEPPEVLVVNGAEAAAHLRVCSVAGGVESWTSVVEIFTVAPDGRVAGIRAFVEPEALAAIA